jgi:hypothetical protein
VTPLERRSGCIGIREWDEQGAYYGETEMGHLSKSGSRDEAKEVDSSRVEEVDSIWIVNDRTTRLGGDISVGRGTNMGRWCHKSCVFSGPGLISGRFSGSGSYRSEGASVPSRGSVAGQWELWSRLDEWELRFFWYFDLFSFCLDFWLRGRIQRWCHEWECRITWHPRCDSWQVTWQGTWHLALGTLALGRRRIFK